MTLKQQAELELVQIESISVLTEFAAYERGELSGKKVLQKIGDLLTLIRSVQLSLHDYKTEYDQLESLAQRWIRNSAKIKVAQAEMR